MKKLLITICAICVKSFIVAQSCILNSVFTTQTEVNNFLVNNPNCTSIEGSVLIHIIDNSDPIWNVDAFSNISEILGDLSILNLSNSVLNPVDLSGFSNIVSITQSLIIDDYPSVPVIQDLSSFINLVDVSDLILKDLKLISNLDVFNNLTSLTNLELSGEFNLFNSILFTNLQMVDNLRIINFNALSFTGFNSLELVNDHLIIDYSGVFGSQFVPFNMDAFHNLTSINSLLMDYVPAENISGFESLQSCNQIMIYPLGGYDLPDFASLTYCLEIYINGTSEDISNFPQLTQVNHITLQGLFTNISFPLLETINYSFTILGYLDYDQIPAIENLDLPNLGNIGNDLTLTNLNVSNLGLPALINVDGIIQIYACPNLSMCNEEFICNKIALEPELVDIHDNGIGCSTLVDIASNCGDLYIQGNVFVDADCNGTFNIGDIEVSHPIILNDSNNPIGTSTSTGEYLFFGQQNTSYTFVPSSVAGTIDGAPITLTTGPDNTAFTNNNFALCPDLLYHDLAATVSSTTMAPGFQSNILLHIENLSYNSETVSLNAVLSLLNVMVINSSSHPYSTSLNTITFDDFTIGAGETITVTLVVTLDVSTPLGTLNSIEANVTNGSTDNDLSNNQDSFQNIVIGSYDPNDISVDREAIDFTQVDQDGEWLVYQIRFQNTGTAPAQFINVVNEQDLNLDMSTIDMIAASHNYELIFNGREITWFFDNIQLPDSTTDLLGSQGYILFRIKTNPGITLDEVIESTAAIYFDYNEPVITNTATTVFYVCPESISAAGNTTYCEGETVTLTANTGYETYNWSLASDIIGTEQTFSADWSAGIYAIEYSGSTLYCISSSVIEIIVNDNPETPSITQIGNTLTASGSGTFTWLYNDQLLNDTDNSIEITASGDYSVSVTANGCTSETSQNNFTYLGINENDLVKMSAFPNPFTDIISLQLPAQTEKITVTDVSGKIVFEKTNIATSSIQLDLSFLEAGSYFITVNSASGAVSEVIVKGTN